MVIPSNLYIVVQQFLTVFWSLQCATFKEMGTDSATFSIGVYCSQRTFLHIAVVVTVRWKQRLAGHENWPQRTRRRKAPNKPKKKKKWTHNAEQKLNFPNNLKFCLSFKTPNSHLDQAFFSFSSPPAPPLPAACFFP